MLNKKLRHWDKERMELIRQKCAAMSHQRELTDSGKDRRREYSDITAMFYLRKAAREV